MINPYAAFDCLAVGVKLQEVLEDVADAELHIFTYLACLLSLYRSRPMSDWGYQHTSTQTGAPFSYDLEKGIPQLLRTGFLRRTQNGNLRVTTPGIGEYESLVQFSQNQQREVFLEGACSSILALPVGVVREALSHEPELARAKALSSTRMLLDGPGLSVLYEQFAALSEVVGVDVEGLMTPSVLWLTYLMRVAQSSNPVFADA